MLRPFLSLAVAAGGTAAGLSLSWFGAVAYARSAAAADPGALLLTLAGVLVAAVAGLSLAIHWVGVLVVGAIHAVLGLLALVVPFGNPFGGGIFSPVFQMTRMLVSVDITLGDGATVFYFSGTALVLGAFLVGAALGVRSRRLAGRSSEAAVAVSSSLGAVALLAATGLLVVAGGTLVRMIVMTTRYDATLAALTVVGGVLSGLAGILLRWSSAGVILAGAIVFVGGIVLFASSGAAPMSPGAVPGSYGLIMLAGATFLTTAAGGVVRERDEVPAGTAAL